MDVLETALAVWIGTELIPLIIEFWWTFLLFALVMTTSANIGTASYISAAVGYVNPRLWVRRCQSTSRSEARPKDEET